MFASVIKSLEKTSVLEYGVDDAHMGLDWPSSLFQWLLQFIQNKILKYIV